MTTLQSTLQRFERCFTSADTAPDQRVGAQFAVDTDIPSLSLENGIRIGQIHAQSVKVDRAAAGGNLRGQ
ncbi:hypothetical protein BFD35_25950 [Escherichia coli]|nr:hypothetical protein BFD35_25950 [Escherichia coli]